MDSSLFSDRNEALPNDTESSGFASDQSRDQYRFPAVNNLSHMSGQWVPSGNLTSNLHNNAVDMTIENINGSSNEQFSAAEVMRRISPDINETSHMPSVTVPSFIGEESSAARCSSPITSNQIPDLSFSVSAVLSASEIGENDQSKGVFDLVKTIEEGEKLITKYRTILKETERDKSLHELIRTYKRQLLALLQRLNELLAEYPAFNDIIGPAIRNWEQILLEMTTNSTETDSNLQIDPEYSHCDARQTEDTMSPEVINVMLIGDTRTGKSSFVNTISGRRDWKRVGGENGESTTAEVSECSTRVREKSVNIYDTPGMNDSQLRLSNKQIKTMLEYHLSSTLTTGVDAFLIFESLQSEAITLRRNLATLVEVFGTAVQKSCIVMLTKEPFDPARAQHIQIICTELKVSTVLWENSHKDMFTGEWRDINQEKLDAQTVDLFFKIDQVENYEIGTLQQLKSQVEAEANRRREAEPVQYEHLSYTVDVPYQEPEVINVKKERPVVKERWKNGRFGKITGLKETYVAYEHYYEPQTIYHQRNRVETRQHQVALPKKPIEHYIEEVKKEKIKTFKQKLK